MSRYIVGATWDDAPHLTKEAKARLWGSIPVYQRDARTKGIPQLGAGAVYPFSESDIQIKDIPIPAHWPRLHSVDAQPLWKSSVTIAWDREADIVYVTHCWKREQVEAAIHVQALLAIKKWIPAVGDASALVRDADREQYIDIYKKCGLKIVLAHKVLEPGIQMVYDRMASLRFKVFASCEEWFSEFRLYRRKKGGKINKTNDHLMDCSRMAVVDLNRAIVRPKPKEDPEPEFRSRDMGGEQAWMGQ